MNKSESSSPESPAKEQPGEQERAPSFRSGDEKVTWSPEDEQRLDAALAQAFPASAPDVAAMVERLEDYATHMEGSAEYPYGSGDLRIAADMIEKLGQRIETLQAAAHNLGWAHKTCPSCGADMLTAALPPPPERP